MENEWNINVIHQRKMYGTMSGYPWMEDKLNKNGIHQWTIIVTLMENHKIVHQCNENLPCMDIRLCFIYLPLMHSINGRYMDIP